MFLNTITQSLTNQTVAVGVLTMLLAGIAWLVKQLFSMLPTLLDRLDKQEEKRAETLDKLAKQIKESNREMAHRIEKTLLALNENLQSCIADVKGAIDEANQLNALFLANIKNNDNNQRFINDNKEK